MNQTRSLPTVGATLPLFFLAPFAWGKREPVLKHIQVPRDFHYREMYLPQLTASPSTLAWSPVGILSWLRWTLTESQNRASGKFSGIR